MKKFVLIVSLFIITIVILIGIDLLIRVIWKYPPETIETIIPDQVLNHKWKPNLEFTDSTRGITPYVLYTNSQSWIGRHDIEQKKPEDTIRIFYFGDSNIQGIVSEEKKMTAIISQEHNKDLSKDGKKIEIINTGTSSWSPSLYYLLIKTQIMKYSPDIVVINVDMTDVRDDALYKQLSKFDENGLPTAVRPSDDNNKENYKLTPQGKVELSTYEKIVKFLHKNSAIYYGMGELNTTLRKNEIVRKIFSKPEISSTPPIDESSWLSLHWNEDAKQNTKYSMFLLENIIKYLKENEVKVIITGVPHYPQYTGVWSSRPHEILEKTTQEYEALYLNSYNTLKSKVTGTDQTKYYWGVDPTHFNEEGNKIWAEIQIKFLLQNKDILFDLNKL